MLGIRTKDGTYVWMDRGRKIHSSGPQAVAWKLRLAARHPLPDYDGKERHERAAAARGEYVIAEPGDIMRRVRSLGELVDVMRRLSSDHEEYVQVSDEIVRRAS